jgi:16S rRNA (cytosine967-C5)-methyltransferase
VKSNRRSPRQRHTSTSREAAFAVLNRAEAADAFVSVLLHRTLGRAALSPADRALAAAITLGVLRHRARLDYALAPLVKGGLDDLPPAIRTIMRMGAFQILDLDRVPVSAATSEAVNLAHAHGHPGTARLVNAVLRRLATVGAPAPPDRAQDPVAHLAVTTSHPRWMLERWVDRWGLDEAEALARTNGQPAPSTLRVNTLRATPADVLAALTQRGIEARPGLVEDAIRTHGSPDLRMPLIEQGLCVPQDEGSMLVGIAVDAAPGALIIDACAGTGGKALHLAAIMRNTGRIVACDVHPAKVDALQRRAAVLDATCIEAERQDAREIGRRRPKQADAVLVDAPCSGLGTIRRRPEIKWRASADALPRHAAQQFEILMGAAGAVRPGGHLVYSVCSLEPEEGDAVVGRFLAASPEFGWAAFGPGVPPDIAATGAAAGRPGEARLFPHKHDTDGFYIARLRRRP